MNQNNQTEKEEKPKLAWYESNVNITDPIKRYLKKYFNVELFREPSNAEEGIADFKPEVILLDYRMRECTGVEMYQRLLNKKLIFIPIFLTIWGNDKSTIEEITALGVGRKAIFDKDTDPEYLSEKVFEYYREKVTS